MQTCTYTLPTLHFVGGSSTIFSFIFLNKDKTPFDGKNQTLIFSAVHYSGRDETPVIQKSTDFVADASGSLSTANVELHSDDTKQLYGKYIYQLTIKRDGASLVIPGQGIMYIDRNIDRTILV